MVDVGKLLRHVVQFKHRLPLQRALFFAVRSQRIVDQRKYSSKGILALNDFELIVARRQVGAKKGAA